MKIKTYSKDISHNIPPSCKSLNKSTKSNKTPLDLCCQLLWNVIKWLKFLHVLSYTL